MSANKKHHGVYSTNRVTYNADGANAWGRNPRPYKQSLFTLPSAIMILLSAAGIVYLLFQTGIIG